MKPINQLLFLKKPKILINLVFRGFGGEIKKVN